MIQINSNDVKKGDTFLALRNDISDSHKYIESAIKNGASKIICEYGKYSVKTVKVKNTRKYLLKYLKKNYYNKIKDIVLIGVTGTSGKTTTCFLIYQLLNKFKLKTAYIGTIGFYIDGKIKDLNNTTPDIYDLYNLLLECKKQHVNVVVMEVSSHALDMGRVDTLKFDIACFTNITREHMDYHKTMDEYFKAKKKLFKKLRNDKIAVINENSYSDELLKLNNNNILIKEEDIKNIEYYIDRTCFKYKNVDFKINLVGKYNIMNYIDAITIVNSLGYEMERISNSKILSPKGRMELIKYKDNSIFIDYAHKPDAVKQVLELISNINKNNVYVIIGCGGNRDKSKRSVMGDIACSNSDYVIFTNDNPRTENPKNILKDITCDLKVNNYEVIENRKKAIKKGISLLTENDILLILGKGHEEYQIIGKEKKFFSDKECTLKILNKILENK